MAARLLPLLGVRVVELAGLAPVPLAGLMLQHAGASVVRVDRCGGALPDVLGSGKRSIALDWKSAAGSAVLQRLIAGADVLLDPFRPGTLEAAGLDAASLAALNHGLVVARVTGYGQDGPLAGVAGHDINYVAAAGVLSLLRREGQPPQVPLNLLADFAAGSALAVGGVAMALLHRERTGRGAVVDVSMAAGTALLASLVSGLQREGLWDALPFLSPGVAPWYDVYGTADGRWVAVGALEPQFYALLLRGTGLASSSTGSSAAAAWPQHDTARWPALRAALTAAFAAQPLSHWAGVFAAGGLLQDACVTPVLTLLEAQAVLQRGASIPDALSGEPLSQQQRELAPALPAPRFSEMFPSAPGAPVAAAAVASIGEALPVPSQQRQLSSIVPPGRHTTEILAELGFGPSDIEGLVASGVVVQEVQAEQREKGGASHDAAVSGVAQWLQNVGAKTVRGGNVQRKPLL